MTSDAWLVKMPLYTVELDYGGDTVTWEFYEIGVVHFRDALTNYEAWAPVWEYALE